MMTNPPQLLFGAAGFGDEFSTADSVREVLEALKAYGIVTVDTAALYPPTDVGASEKLLGEAAAAKLGFKVDTKVLVTGMDTSGTLEPAKIEASVNTSFQRLQLQHGHHIRVLHAHAPDTTTPIKDQAAAFDAEYRKGRFEKFGVCNFPPDTLKEYLEVCDKEGYVKPSVYQGRYNVIARELEGIFPLLREHGIVFNAHSPLGTGFLSGSLTSGNIAGSRFAEGNIMGMSARQQYDRKEMHDVINHLSTVLEPVGITKVEAALRWLCFHSKLNDGDGVILGASKLVQLKQNVESIKNGPLPEDIVSAMNALWETVRPQ